MNDALDGHQGTVRIGCRNITKLRFVDNIDCRTGKDVEPSLMINLYETSPRYDMEISRHPFIWRDIGSALLG